jgi:hypothetical protein
MKTARWYGILCLSFFLWLLLFPPWMESRRTYLEGRLGQFVSEDEVFPAVVSHPLGHHWRFSVPSHWEWSELDQQSFFVPNLGARIDHRLMLYEVVIGLVAIGLLSLLLPALVMPLRRMTAYAKVEIILMETRIRNWRNRDLRRTMTGVRK